LAALTTIGHVVVEPRINPETVEALLDTTWRVASAEAGRTYALDRKAATLATFGSLLTSLTATLGSRSLDTPVEMGTALAFSAGLIALLLSAAFAVAALVPREHLALGMPYLQRFPTWSEIRKTPTEVRGDTMRGLIEALAREREANEHKARLVRRGFACLLIGLVFIAGEAAILAAGDVAR